MCATAPGIAERPGGRTWHTAGTARTTKTAASRNTRARTARPRRISNRRGVKGSTVGDSDIAADDDRNRVRTSELNQVRTDAHITLHQERGQTAADLGGERRAIECQRVTVAVSGNGSVARIAVDTDDLLNRVRHDLDRRQEYLVRTVVERVAVKLEGRQIR